MNKYSFYILSAFVLGATSALFFVHINFAYDNAPHKGGTTPFSAAVLGALTSDFATSTLASSSISISTASLPPTPLPVYVVNTVAAATSTPKKYLYKIVRDVDACTMNKLGTLGWQAYQFAGNTESYYGYDENCKNGKIYDTVFEWVLFSNEN